MAKRRVWSKPRAGTVFKHPKLYRFAADGIDVLRGWPDILGYRGTRAGWRNARPHIQVLAGDLKRQIAKFLGTGNGEQPSSRGASPRANHRMICHLMWYEMIPRQVRRLVARYQAHRRHWHVLSLFARQSRGGRDLQLPVELALSSPALWWALSSSWVYKSKPVARPHRSIRALLAKPGRSQAALLEWLDFPSTANSGLSHNANVPRIMRRIVARSVDVVRLLYLRDTLLAGGHAVTRLQHLDRINAGALRLLTDSELLAVPEKLLVEIAHDPGNDVKPHSAWLYNDSIAMCIRMNTPVCRPQSIQGLADVHDELVEQLNRCVATGSFPKVDFPAPPVVGNSQIRPIENSVALDREGSEMSHCCGILMPQIIAEKSFVFSVKTDKDRATLEINRHRGRWVVRQLLSFRNKKVRPATRRIVEKWLEAQVPPEEI